MTSTDTVGPEEGRCRCGRVRPMVDLLRVTDITSGQSWPVCRPTLEGREPGLCFKLHVGGEWAHAIEAIR